MTKQTKEKLLPLLLTAAIIIFDQTSKFLILRFIPPFTIGVQFFGDFLRIINVANTGIAFSIGNELSQNIRSIFFIVMPLLVLCLILGFYFKTNDFTKLQRWALAGVIGGGFGNIIDRIFRPAGVVDFIDVKFYGLFGLERWPTFNIADSSVVVCGILLFISFLLPPKKDTV